MNSFPYADKARLVSSLIPVALVLSLLGACASQKVFEDCGNLADREDTEAALTQVQQALREQPQSQGCLRAGLLLRERVTLSQLRQAERLRQQGDWTQAAGVYRRVLSVSPAHPDAREGLAVAERQDKARKLIEQARSEMLAQDLSKARSSLETALQLDATSAEARGLLAEVVRGMAQPLREAGMSEKYKKPVSLEFRDAPLRAVFEALSMGSGINFVFDKDVKTDQRTTILLRDSTVESALYFLLVTNQLDQQVMNGNTVLVYPNLPAKQKDYQELSVRTFQLANADAKTVAAALKILFKGRDIVVDDKLNMLTVRDTPEAIRAVEKMIALHDIAEPEVMLEVEILEVSRDRLLNLGVELPGSLSLSPLASGLNLTVNDLRGLNGSNTGVSIGNVTLNAKKANSDINILANPRIRVVNREKAKVQIGEKVPVISAVLTSGNSVATENVSYVDVGLKLEVEPVIYKGNDIMLKIGLEVSNISGSTISKQGSVAYSFGTRNANTVLRLRDGENQILAGLINDEDRKVASKLPGLGELPGVGRLFGTQEDSGKKTEIVLSITPRLNRRVHLAEALGSEFRSGTESNIRERPSQVVPVANKASLSAPAPAPAPAPEVRVPPVVPQALVTGLTTMRTETPVPRDVVPLLSVLPAAQTTAPVHPPAVAPTAAENELASIAITALKSYGVTRQINQTDGLLPPLPTSSSTSGAINSIGR